MTFTKFIGTILILFLVHYCFAQNNNIQVSICIQHANTYNHVFGAAVFIKKIDDNNVIMSVDSMYSAVFIPASFEVDQRYNIVIKKKGFYTLDTVITTRVSSTSNKQRWGLFLHPIVCHQLKGKVLEANTLNKIETGKILVTNLYTNESSEVEIKNGYYEFCGLSENAYELKTQVDGHFDAKERILLSKNRSIKHDEQETELDLYATQNYDNALFKGDSITVHNLIFIDETSTLSIMGEQEVNRLIKVMKEMPQLLVSIAVQVEGLIDARFNRKLAEQRARMLEHKLTVGGISPHRYLLVCQGKVDGTTPICCKNQRVCLWIRK